MAILIFVSVTAYRNSPPIPGGVVDPKGEMVFTGKDILAGQEVFLKYALSAASPLYHPREPTDHAYGK